MREHLNRLNITEDGEAIGTLQQFAESLNLPRAFILQCLQDELPSSVILNAGEGLDRLLILDTKGLETLLRRAAQAQALRQVVSAANDSSARAPA